MKDNPQCLCGVNDWKQGGVVFSRMEQRNFICRSCGRPGEFLYVSGCGGFFLPTEADGDLEAATDYINEVVLVTWRAQAEKAEEARSRLVASEWAIFCQQHSIPVNTERDKVPKRLEALASDFFCEISERRGFRIPTGFEKAPMPSKLPKTLTMFLLIQGASGRGWEQVKHADTEQLEASSDPILVHHNEYYDSFFASLAEMLGVPIERKEVENEYSRARNEPWFQFKLGKVTFVVGPRHRVVAIEAIVPKSFSSAEIYAAARKDNVTYSRQATKISVHAWDTEQLERYLTILGRAALGQVVSTST